MDSIKTRGIIARKSDYGESNSMLTIFSRELGIISACAYGVRSGKSKQKAGIQVFCLCDFVLSKKGGDIYKVDSAELAESFYPLCEDFEKLALASYFMEVIPDVFADGDADVLSLLLNSLYVLAYKDVAPELVKAVFELRLSKLSGYEPEVGQCMICGSEAVSGFDLSGGTVCRTCKGKDARDLSLGSIYAMRYILNADEKRLFSFEVTDDVLKELSGICEKYFTDKTEKSYKALEYYKKIKRM